MATGCSSSVRCGNTGAAYPCDRRRNGLISLTLFHTKKKGDLCRSLFFLATFLSWDLGNRIGALWCDTRSVQHCSPSGQKAKRSRSPALAPICGQTGLLIALDERGSHRSVVPGPRESQGR